MATNTSNMQFDTDPAKQEKLIGMIHDEVNQIVANGPRAEDVQKVKENLLKTYNENQRENSWWLGTIEDYYTDKIDMGATYKAAVESLTPALIQSTLKSLIQQENILEVVMKPAKK